MRTRESSHARESLRDAKWGHAKRECGSGRKGERGKVGGGERQGESDRVNRAGERRGRGGDLKRHGGGVEARNVEEVRDAVVPRAGRSLLQRETRQVFKSPQRHHLRPN